MQIVRAKENYFLLFRHVRQYLHMSIFITKKEYKNTHDCNKFNPAELP